jgi:putative nucleotidyltransferase with HDIG domain
MGAKDALNPTHAKLIPLVSTDFLPEKDISQDISIREDYEKLRITYELQRDIGSEIEIDSVLNRILDRTLEFLKYDRAIILLLNEERKLKVRAYKNNTNGKGYPLSTTLLKRAANNRKGVISSDVLADKRFSKSESIMVSGIRSTMAAPIFHQDELLGIIVIEKLKRVGAFKEKDLRLIMNIANHAAQFIKNSLLHEELRISFRSAIRTLSATVDARHPLTAGHSERVAKLSLLIAKELAIRGNRLEALRYAALLHDIGKIGIADKILLKRGTFESHERKEMETHPTKTKNILEKFHFPKNLKNIPDIAALHHERIDGMGYPSGKSGIDIPLEAKIISVADVFDALTSPREYPKYDETGNLLDCDRMSVSEAAAIIEKGIGTHFEAKVVKAFKHCLPLALIKFRGKHFKSEYVEEYIKAEAPNLLSKILSGTN